MAERSQKLMPKPLANDAEGPPRTVINVTEVSFYVGFPFGRVIMPAGRRIASRAMGILFPGMKEQTNTVPVEKAIPARRQAGKAA